MSGHQVIRAVELEGGGRLLVSATELTIDDDDEEVVNLARSLSFDRVVDNVRVLGQKLVSTFEAISPSKAKVELGVQLAVESGELTALIVQGTATANLTITLEWER